jgi:hypothetical protein
MKTDNATGPVLLGILGAILGGLAGYFAFSWLLGQGFYALLLPPALLGLGAGLLARRRSVPLAIICGIAGLALALFVEWRFRPFTANSTFNYFISHLSQLTPVTLIMAGIGAVLSFRLGLGWDRKK